MLNPGTFEKVLMYPIRPNVSKKNMVKMPKIIFLNNFLGNFQNIGEWIQQYVQIHHNF